MGVEVGTALNLFLFDLPRLSVDIDLNYVGALEREAMLADRPKVEQAVQAVFSREGFTIKRVPTEHAGGKWRLGYRSYTGQSGNLEVDLNFMFRQPLWEIQPAVPMHSEISRPGISLSQTCMSWQPANSLHCWHAVRQGICSIVTECSQ